MGTRFVMALLLAGGMTLASSAAQAGGLVSSLSETSAVEMSPEELAEVRGANHVIRLVEFRSGATLTAAAAITEPSSPRWSPAVVSRAVR
jgi:hypothetical protein